MAKGNQIRIQYKWEIRETEIDTVYYTRMRDFYTQMIAIEAEQFVFAKIKKPIAPLSKVVPAMATPQKEKRTAQKKGKK
jgi:hypothetical protein